MLCTTGYTNVDPVMMRADRDAERTVGARRLLHESETHDFSRVDKVAEVDEPLEYWYRRRKAVSLPRQLSRSITIAQPPMRSRSNRSEA